MADTAAILDLLDQAEDAATAEDYFTLQSLLQQVMLILMSSGDVPGPEVLPP
jgi:hypothetical protein